MKTKKYRKCRTSISGILFIFVLLFRTADIFSESVFVNP